MVYTFNKLLPLREKYMEVSYMVQDCLKTLVYEYGIGFDDVAAKLDKFVNYIPYLTEDQLKEFVSEDEINAWYNSLTDDITVIDKDTVLENFLEIIEVGDNKIYINEEVTQESFLSIIGSLTSGMAAAIVGSNLINSIIANFNICRDNCKRRFAQEDDEKIRKLQEKNCLLDCEMTNYRQALIILESRKREVCDQKTDPIHCMTQIDNKIQKVREKMEINRNNKREVEQKLSELQNPPAPGQEEENQEEENPNE